MTTSHGVLVYPEIVERRIREHPELAAAILRKLGYTVTLRRTKKSIEERPSGWGEAAWQRYLLAKRADTQAKLDKLSETTMGVCDRLEGPPGNAPSFRFRFRYGAADMNDYMAKFAKLGVSEGLSAETQEESAAKEWEWEVRRQAR